MDGGHASLHAGVGFQNHEPVRQHGAAAVVARRDAQRVAAVVRAVDTVRYSEWSEGVEWLVLQGVDQPEVGQPEVVLRPNPAKERVEVVSPAEVKRIEVYDAGGVKWRELPKGTSGFAVDEWPKGTYMVVVHTSAGTVTKRLVVE